MSSTPLPDTQTLESGAFWCMRQQWVDSQFACFLRLGNILEMFHLLLQLVDVMFSMCPIRDSFFNSSQMVGLFKVSMTFLGGGNGTPLQYSCLENPMDGGAWWAAVHGVAQSQTRLSDFTFTFTFLFHALEKEMATHSSVLAWRIPGMAEPGGLPSMGSQSRTQLKWLSSMTFLSWNDRPGVIMILNKY